MTLTLYANSWIIQGSSLSDTAPTFHSPKQITFLCFSLKFSPFCFLRIIQIFYLYSGTPLIRSRTGQKILAILMRGFLQGKVWPFCRVAKESGRNNEVTVLLTRRWRVRQRSTELRFLGHFCTYHGVNNKDYFVITMMKAKC